MKVYQLFFGLSMVALLAACARRPTRLEIYDVVINHVTVVDVVTGQLQANQVVAISRGKIITIEPADKGSYAARQYVNGNGRYLIPGLWDMHVHFRGGDSLIAANKKTLALFLAHGITTVRDAGGDMTPSVLQWRQDMDAGKLPGPRIFTSGPKIDGPQAYWPGSLGVETPAQIHQALDSLQRLRVDYVKIDDSTISGPAYLETIRQAQRRGLKTTGQLPGSVTLGQAVKRGLDATEHLYYVFKACSGKEDSLTTLAGNSLNPPGALGLFAGLPAAYDTYSPVAAADIFRLMAKHHTAVVPTLYSQRSLAEPSRNDHRHDTLRAYLDPGIQATYARRSAKARQQSPSARAFSQKLNTKLTSLVPLMQQAGVTILAGSDSGPFNSFVYPGHSLQEELTLLVQAGLTPLQALQAATINGAKFMGAAGRSGTIALGKDADLVLLTGNPLQNIGNIRKIDAVISRGRAYPAAALANLLRNVKNQ
ncbi:amidohydrolase family protein [Hymenobacter sp. BT664]|uniref:Amidohydrolase family protein n=1 Tax=Hymenobacter montanus TaxID=2771359 RepID=A0A927BGH3_9BACT|nr:amidohydrolase family protein [Hymenobacter montanus]MBD2770435.1 amidohydrolase family protein [Hymenobacter montanus]